MIFFSNCIVLFYTNNLTHLQHKSEPWIMLFFHFPWCSVTILLRLDMEQWSQSLEHSYFYRNFWWFWTAFYWEVWERIILVEFWDFSVKSFLFIYLIPVYEDAQGFINISFFIGNILFHARPWKSKDLSKIICSLLSIC